MGDVPGDFGSSGVERIWAEDDLSREHQRLVLVIRYSIILVGEEIDPTS